MSQVAVIGVPIVNAVVAVDKPPVEVYEADCILDDEDFEDDRGCPLWRPEEQSPHRRRMFVLSCGIAISVAIAGAVLFLADLNNSNSNEQYRLWGWNNPVTLATDHIALARFGTAVRTNGSRIVVADQLHRVHVYDDGALSVILSTNEAQNTSSPLHNALELSEDGLRIVLGVPSQDAVHVWDQVDGTWSPYEPLHGIGWFGHSVALLDNDTIAIGSPMSRGPYPLGIVEFFELSNGTTWVLGTDSIEGSRIG